MNKKRCFALVASLAFSSGCLADATHLSDHSPINALGKVLLIENGDKYWIQVDAESFKHVRAVTLNNNYRSSQSVFAAHIFGLGIYDDEQDPSKFKRANFKKISELGETFYKDQEVMVYCSAVNAEGMPDCLVYRDMIDPTTKVKTPISINELVLDQGLAKVNRSAMTKREQRSNMMKVVDLAESKGKASKLGVWGQHLNLLPDDF